MSENKINAGEFVATFKIRCMGYLHSGKLQEFPEFIQNRKQKYRNVCPVSLKTNVRIPLLNSFYYFFLFCAFRRDSLEYRYSTGGTGHQLCGTV